jgi:coenzyme Q-binding protein COQ10
MPHLKFERHVPHPPERMFALVADLESYPRFVPNVSSMAVKSDMGRADDVRFARMSVKFGPIADSYTSRVTLNPAARTIDARAVDGPFRHLSSTWSFEPEGQGSCIRFEIDFKFSNPVVAAVAEPAFAAKQGEIIDAFLREATRRYG